MFLCVQNQKHLHEILKFSLDSIGNVFSSYKIFKMNWLRNVLLYCVVVLTFKFKCSLTLPLIRRPSNHCSHGLCPVIPKQSKIDPTTFYCPPRYRLNLDICIPTKKLCEDALKHGLYCTTSNRIRKLQEEWIELKNLIQVTNQ